MKLFIVSVDCLRKSLKHFNFCFFLNQFLLTEKYKFFFVGNNDAESALSEYHSTVSTHLTPGTPTNGSNFTARTPVAPPPPPPPLIRPTCKTIVNPAAQNPKVQKSQLSPAGVTKLADSLKRGSLPRDSSSGCWKEFNQKEILDAVRNATSSSSQGKRALPASVKGQFRQMADILSSYCSF